MNNKKLKKSTIKKIALIASLIAIFVFLTGKNLPDIFEPKESSPSQPQVINNNVNNVTVYTQPQDTSSDVLQESSPAIPPEITPMPTPVQPTPKASSNIHQPENIEVYPSDTAKFTVGASKAVTRRQTLLHLLHMTATTDSNIAASSILKTEPQRFPSLQR